VSLSAYRFADVNIALQMSNEIARYRILKDGSEITPNDKLKVKKEGSKVTLNVANVSN